MHKWREKPTFEPKEIGRRAIRQTDRLNEAITKHISLIGFRSILTLLGHEIREIFCKLRFLPTLQGYCRAHRAGPWNPCKRRESILIVHVRWPDLVGL